MKSVVSKVEVEAYTSTCTLAVKSLYPPTCPHNASEIFTIDKNPIRSISPGSGLDYMTYGEFRNLIPT